MISGKFECRKFSANMFNLTKCQHCFRPKEQHTAEALECNRASRKISKCGYLFVAPDWDFSVAVNRTKRWQRRWFVLYEDGELTFSVDEHPDTIPQAVVDMTKVTEVCDAEEMTGSKFAIAIKTPDKVHFVKGTCKEESKWWFDVLVSFPRNNKSKSKRNATFTSIKTTVSPTQVSCTHQSWCVAYPQVESSSLITSTRCCQQIADTSRITAINDSDLVVPTRNIEIIIADSHSHHSYGDPICSNRTKSRRDSTVTSNSEELVAPLVASPNYPRFSDIPLMKRYESLESLDIDRNRSVCSPRTSFCHTDDKPIDSKDVLHLHSKLEGSENWKENTVRGDPDGCGLDQIVYSPGSTGEMMRVDALEHLPKNMYHVKKGWLLKQDLVKSGEWCKKWCVLYSTHMKIFQDQAAEDRGPLECVIYMDCVQHVEEVDVNRNYGFKIKITDGSYHIFSAVTLGIRSGWVSALKNSANICGLTDDLMLHLSRPSTIDLEQKTSVHSSISLEDQTSLSCNVTHTTHSLDGGIVSVTTSIPNTSNCSSVNNGNGNVNSRNPPMSPPLNRTAISRVKERAKLKTTSKVNLPKSNEKLCDELVSNDSVDSTTEKTSHRKERSRRCTLPVKLNTSLKKSEVSSSSHSSSRSMRERDSRLDRGSEKKGLSSVNQIKNASNGEDSSIHLANERKMHLGSLSDLTNIEKDVDPETAPRDKLAVKYQELRERFEKAVDEIRALQKELKEAHFKCDHLELACLNKKRATDAIENDYQSQLSLMSVRIEDLTNKLNMSEKQLRLQPKTSKSVGGTGGKEQRRTRSLKGKESLTVSKEVETKVEELEKKLKTVEGVMNCRLNDSLDLPVKQEFTTSENEKASEKSHLFVRLNSLEAKIEEAVSKVVATQPNFEICDDRSSTIDSEADISMRLTVSELMSKIDHLCKRVTLLEDTLGRCRLKVELAKNLISSETSFNSLEEHLNEVITCLDSCLFTRHHMSCEHIHERVECFHEVIVRRIHWLQAALEAVLSAVESGESPQWPNWSTKSLENDLDNLNSLINELEPMKTILTNRVQPWLNDCLKLLTLRVSAEVANQTSFKDTNSVVRLRECFLMTLTDLAGKIGDGELGEAWSSLLVGGEDESLWPRIVEDTLVVLNNEVQNVDAKNVDCKYGDISEETFAFVAGGYAFLSLAIESLQTHLKTTNKNSLANHSECEKRRTSFDYFEENDLSTAPRIVGEVMKKSDNEAVECLGCVELHRRMKHMAEKYANDLLLETEKHESKLDAAHKEQGNILANLKEEKSTECERYKTEVDRLQNRLKDLEEEYEEQLLSLKQMFEAELAKRVDVHINLSSVQTKYKTEIEQLKTLCEKGLAAMEHSHKRIVAELEEKWKRKSEKLQAEKEQALAEETKATLAALDAMRKAHEAELQKEVARFKEEFLEKMGHSSADLDALHREHEEEMETIKREILSLSEKYSDKCLECAALDEHLEAKHQELAEANAIIIDLTARNKQLRSHLKQNVKELSNMKVDSSSDLLISLRLKEGLLLEKEEEISDLCRKLASLQPTSITIEPLESHDRDSGVSIKKTVSHIDL
ncbi:hypothetical protein CHUAL_012893 [Chamberlinius hualienensis]